MGTVRVHYFVDDSSVWQNLREDEVGWHSGDGNTGPGNGSTISIEIIMNGSGDAKDVKAEDKGALLTAILLWRYGLGTDKLYTHNHWYSPKYCPAYILPHWDAFVKKVENNLAMLENKQTPEPTPIKLYRVQVGAFSNKANAEALLLKLKDAGFIGYIKEE
jgi:N-acetylmuramoyl-L-alanine amidase CwlA